VAKKTQILSPLALLFPQHRPCPERQINRKMATHLLPRGKFKLLLNRTNEKELIFHRCITRFRLCKLDTFSKHIRTSAHDNKKPTLSIMIKHTLNFNKNAYLLIPSCSPFAQLDSGTDNDSARRERLETLAQCHALTYQLSCHCWAILTLLFSVACKTFAARRGTEERGINRRSRKGSQETTHKRFVTTSIQTRLFIF
jgi:hypothetical protein